MQDKVLGMLIFVPVAIIVLLVLAMALIDFLEQEPVNPVGSIPKVIIDHHENETVVTVKAVGEHRYDAIHINYTVGDGTHNRSAFDRYVLDTSINQTEFVLNITVLRGQDQYIYNCSVQVEALPEEPIYVWVMEEDDVEHSRHRNPFKTLAEWREIK
jgi:hypothetical protein